MARTPNYGFEKRRREQERQAKKEAKARRKAEQQAAEGEGGAAPDMTGDLDGGENAEPPEAPGTNG